VKKEQLETLKKETSSTKKLSEKLEAINVVKPTRVVHLKYKSCCGCGCYDETVERTVPFDSPLNNGDRIDRLEGDDRML
jgi:hypothetical protein